MMLRQRDCIRAHIPKPCTSNRLHLPFFWCKRHSYNTPYTYITLSRSFCRVSQSLRLSVLRLNILPLGSVSVWLMVCICNNAGWMEALFECEWWVDGIVPVCPFFLMSLSVCWPLVKLYIIWLLLLTHTKPECPYGIS